MTESLPVERSATETKLQATLVDAHTKPAVDAGSIPAASTENPLFAGGFLLWFFSRQSGLFEVPANERNSRLQGNSISTRLVR